MVRAQDQFGISGINKSDTRVALTKREIEQEKRELRSILNMGMPLTEDQRNRIINKITGVTPITDASKSKIYSDSPQTLGGTEGSLIASVDPSKIRGISAPAPETKISETRMAGDGFFSPKNFQKSGLPDATIMTREQMAQSLFGDPGRTRFGSLDRPSTQAAKDTAAFNEAYKKSFFSPRETDARSIAERKEESTQAMRDRAAENFAAFKERGGRPAPTTRISGDDTYGTNVMSNPAFGFRSKLSDENKSKYDASAREATRRAEVEPSKGNLITSVANMAKRVVNEALPDNPFTKEKKLETRGEAELRRYEKFLNRPTYQKEATARVEAGITPQMIREKNVARIREDAAARNKEFQAEKRAKAVERASKRTKANTGTGRDGTFGAGTVGQGMPSNPAFRGAGNNKGFKKSDSSESKNTPKKAVAKATAQKSASVGKSTGRGGKRGGSTGGSGSSSKGGVSRGGARTNRSKSRRRCDIRCKYDIMPLTDMNLIKDDLAEIAYFVKELQA